MGPGRTARPRARVAPLSPPREAPLLLPLKAKGEAAQARVSAARSVTARSAAARSAAVVAAASGRQSGKMWRRECHHRDPTVRRRTDRRPRSLAGLNPPGWELSCCSFSMHESTPPPKNQRLSRTGRPKSAQQLQQLCRVDHPPKPHTRRGRRAAAFCTNTCIFRPPSRLTTSRTMASIWSIAPVQPAAALPPIAI
jgi:hypothetical protein